MTLHHVGALLIAALLFITCELSSKCTDQKADRAFQLSMMIVVGVVGHAGAEMRKKSGKPDHDTGSDAK